MTSKFVRQSLMAASLVTIGTSILSRFFGYAREAVIASYFGTSATLDLFILAFTIPELITFISYAALPTALIPSLRRANVSNRDQESVFFWSGLINMSLLFGGLALLVYLVRGSILNLLAPTLEHDAVTQGRHLMAILAGLIFFRGMESYFRSWLFEKKHFVVPATSTIVLNIVILTTLLGFHGRLEIEALAYGWLMAAIVLFAYNGFFAFLFVKPKIRGRAAPAPISILMKATISIAIVESIALIYPVVDRYLAARFLGEGQIAALRYATFLIHIPTGMFIVAFSQASFPWVSDLSVPDQIERLRKLYTESMRLIFFVMGLVAVGVIIYTNEVVTVAFQRGAFDATSQILTSGPLMYFALGIVFYSIYFFQMKFYYARGAVGRLVRILIGMLAIKIILSLLLVKPMEQNGLALATAFTWFCGAIFMTADLSRTIKVSLRELVFPSLPKVLFCLLVTALFWIGLGKVWIGPPSESLLQLLLRLAGIGVSGIVVYLAMAWILKLPELKQTLDRVLRKFSGA